MLVIIQTMAFALFFIHIQLHGMLGPNSVIPIDDTFEIYLQNGNSEGDNFSIKDPYTIQNLHKHIPFFTFTNDRSSDAYASILSKLPNHEIIRRYRQYGYCWQEFIAKLATKQLLLNALKKETSRNSFNRLSEGFKYFEQRMTILSKWLTAIRNSGEESYIHSCIKPSLSFDQKIFALFKTSCELNGQNTPLLYLDPISMARFRHQLYNGTALEYKKTTEYTGPAICHLKFKDGKTCNWSYDKLMKILGLAEKKKESEPNNLLLGINGWRETE